MSRFYQILVFVCTAVALSKSSCQAGVYEYKVSPSEIEVIVNKHNELRSLITKGQVAGQPRGTNLKQLQWDPELARQAQNIANNCIFEHVRVYDGRWFAVGQNLFAWYSTGYKKGSDWSTAIQGWFDEYKVYRFTYPYYTHETGHYTQLVWADTTHVGCGYTFYKASGNYKYQKLYVCNYGPAGNVVGQPPYRTG